jgi:hypothetical protein
LDTFSLYTHGLKDGNRHPTAAWRKRFLPIEQVYHYPVTPEAPIQWEASVYFDTESDRQVCRYTMEVRARAFGDRGSSIRRSECGSGG